MRRLARSFVKNLFDKYGYQISRKNSADLLYLHHYDGGYDQYKEVQVRWNKEKLDRVWADMGTLDTVAAYLKSHTEQADYAGICHGARNGFEVNYFNDNLPGKAIGTDISDTATQFEDMIVWDFHEVNPEWERKFDYVYSNSLDQAMDPEKALKAWSGQVKPGGLLFIEHTMAHSATGAGEMDPFGAHPMCMPYLFFRWGKGRYVLHDIIDVDAKANNQIRAWVFVLKAL